MQSYHVSTIAKLLNLSERRVQQLAKDAIIPRAEKGNYDLVGSVQGYIKYLYDRGSGFWQKWGLDRFTYAILEKPAGLSNEALDYRVYVLAALHILNPDLESLADRMTNEKKG